MSEKMNKIYHVLERTDIFLSENFNKKLTQDDIDFILDTLEKYLQEGE